MHTNPKLVTTCMLFADTFSSQGLYYSLDVKSIAFAVGCKQFYHIVPVRSYIQKKKTKQKQVISNVKGQGQFAVLIYQYCGWSKLNKQLNQLIERYLDWNGSKEVKYGNKALRGLQMVNPSQQTCVDQNLG